MVPLYHTRRSLQMIEPRVDGKNFPRAIIILDTSCLVVYWMVDMWPVSCDWVMRSIRGAGREFNQRRVFRDHSSCDSKRQLT